MWVSLVTFNYLKLKEISYEMGIGDYFWYLPLFFTFWTINSTKKLGHPGITDEEKEYLKENDEVNMEKVSHLLSVLPAEICFITKAT